MKIRGGRSRGWASRSALVGAVLTTGWGVRHVVIRPVRRWQRSPVPPSTVGRLSTRVVGMGTPATVLLHGLAGCGDYFGAKYDALAEDRRLVIPDLLGFGDSYLADAPTGYALEAQLDALDEMAAALDLSGPLTIVGHSMGAALALNWAARRVSQVKRVVAFSAPLYSSPEEGLKQVRGLGLMEGVLALDTPISRAACKWMCTHRMTASWLAPGVEPRLPIYLARRGVLHTWPAYHATMETIVLQSPWQEALAILAAEHVPVVLANGDRDPVPVAGRADHLATQFPNLQSHTHPSAGHDLPIAEPNWCIALLAAVPSDELAT